MFYKNAVRVRTLTDRYVVSLDIYKSDFMQETFASILLSELDEGWTTTLAEGAVATFETNRIIKAEGMSKRKKGLSLCIVILFSMTG